MPFGSASTTQYSLCPSGHVGYMKNSAEPMSISIFVVGGTGSEYGPPVAVIWWQIRELMTCEILEFVNSQ